MSVHNHNHADDEAGEVMAQQAHQEVARLRADLAAMRAENERLREALNEVMPRYVELFEAAGLGDAKDSVAVQLARAALGGEGGGKQPSPRIGS